MADFWDPFADPADLVPPPPKPSRATKEKGSAASGDGDLLAAWRAVLQEAAAPPPARPQALSREELEASFSALFDPDIPVSEKAEVFDSIAAEAELRWEVRAALWKRAIPLIMDEALRAHHASLFGWMVEFESGLRPSANANKMEGNEVSVDSPVDASRASSNLVVLLLGWGGGSVAELSDAVEEYQRRCPGALIIRMAWNAKASWALRRSCAKALQQATRFWASSPASGSTSNPPKLLVHLFSNMGFITWTEMLKCWMAARKDEEFTKSLPHPLPPVQQVLQGVILDSACNDNIEPEACVRSAVQSMAAFLHRVEAADHDGSEAGAKAAEVNGRKVKFILLGPKSPVWDYLLSHQPERLIPPCRAETKTVRELEPPCATLFIYSKDDSVVLAAGVEDYLNYVETSLAGSGVSAPESLVFEESPHVMHKVKFKDQYWSSVTAFLQKLSLTGES